MIVVPKRAERFVGVTKGWMIRRKPGADARMVLIVELTGFEEVARKPVALRRRVPVVQCVDTDGSPNPVLLLAGRCLILRTRIGSSYRVI